TLFGKLAQLLCRRRQVQTSSTQDFFHSFM
ncbi:MAG: hypothetical protein ACI9JR_000095, partial [Gammaproteobacteria bacterium]